MALHGSSTAVGGLIAANNLSDVPSPVTAALNLSGTYGLAQSGAAASHTGDLVETQVASATVAANAMGANGALHVVALFTLTGTAAGKTARFKLGGTTVATISIPSSATSYRIDVIIANANATGSQVINGFGVSNAGAVAAVAGTASLDMTQAQTLTITEQLGNAADSVTLVFSQFQINPHS